MDVLAGGAVGSTTFLLGSLKCYMCEELARQTAFPDFLVRDLAQAAEVIEKLETGDRASAQRFAYRCFAAQEL